MQIGMIWGARPAPSMLGGAATVLAMAASALAADVNVTSNVSTGINLDTFTGSTVEVFPGVSVTNSSASAMRRRSARGP